MCRKLFLLWLVTSSAWASPGSFVIADVSINGTAQRQAMILVRPDGTICTRRADLIEWQINTHELPTENLQNVDHVCLSNLQGIKAHYQSGVLAIEATELAFRGTQIDLQRADISTIDGGKGAFINYDFSHFASRNVRPVSAAAVETVVYVDTLSFASNGVFSSAAGGPKFVRYETNMRWDLPDQVKTLVLGDSVARSGTIARGFRFGGISFGTNFAIRPDVVTFALPAIPGESRIPTAADLLINGVPNSRFDLNPGPFEIRNVPALNGAGDIQLITRDALGRQQVLVVPYYVSASLLREGLTDSGFELGKVREDFGLESYRYGRHFARGLRRHGLSPTLTAEAFAETDGRTHVIGGTLTGAVGSFAIASGSIAVSEYAETGGSFAASLERSARGLSFGLRGQYATAHFAQLGDNAGIRYRFNGSFGASLDKVGNISVIYAVESRYDRGRIATAAVSYQKLIWKRVSLFANVSASRTPDGTRHFAGVVLVMPIDSLTSASASSTSQDGRSEHVVDMRQNLPIDTGWATRARATQGDNHRLRTDAGVTVQNAYGQWLADVSSDGTNRSARFGMNGSLVAAGGVVRAVRQLGDAFAIVSVPGHAGIDVFHENQRVAQTDSAGFAIVPRLRAFEANAVSLDTLKLSLSTELSAPSRKVTPARRAGVLLQFKAGETHGALIRVVQEGGETIPAGAYLTANSENFSFAANSEVWVTGLGGETRALVQWRGERCAVNIPMPDKTKARPRLGPLVCVRANS
jgi:outer membrane usher protein